MKPEFDLKFSQKPLTGEKTFFFFFLFFSAVQSDIEAKIVKDLFPESFITSKQKESWVR